MKKFPALFTALVLLLCLCACSTKVEEPTWQEQFDLGVRYLSEGNYQEAIIAFAAAVEIEPKQAELYIRLADAYIGLNDYGKAREVIGQGLMLCEDEDGLALLSNYLYELDNDTDISSLLRMGDQGNIVTYDEVNFLGHGIENLNYDVAKDLATQSGYNIHETDDAFYAYRFDSFYPAPSIRIEQVEKWEDGTCVNCWIYSHGLEGIEFSPEEIRLRGIMTLDSLETVLSKLSFTTSSSIAEIANSAVDQVKGAHYSSIEEIMTYNDRFRGKAFYSSGNASMEVSLRWNQREYYTITGTCIGMSIQGDDGYHYSLQFDFQEDHLVNFMVMVSAF